MARPRKLPIPLTIVAGPLGAGKTTLINRLLRDPAFANTAVILNEFGEAKLENAVVERAEDGIIALAAGCICCAVRGELIDALERLLRDLDNGRIAAIGRVIVESDAAADPAAIFAAVARHPYLSLRFRPDGIVAVIRERDAVEILAKRRETVRQVAMADVIAVSRPAGGVGPLLATINPFAAIADAGSAAPSAFMGHGAFDPANTDIERWLGPHLSPGPPPGANAEAARVQAFTIVRERPIPLVGLERFLEFLVALQGPNLIRVRGVVATGEGGSVVVEGIGGFFWPPLLLGQPADSRTRFAVIASNLDRQGFESYLDAFLNEARIDTPDRQALTDNPLAIAGFSARSGR